MNWQEILVGIILGIAVYFLIKKYTKKDDNCNTGSCCNN
jgi:predicted small secreted protein